MIRARALSRGSGRPSFRLPTHGVGRGLVVVLATALVVSIAACDVSITSPAGDATPSAGVTDGSSTPAPTGEPQPPSPSEPADATGSVSPSDGPDGSPTPSGGPNGSAAGCSGSLENRDFLSSVASAVDWDVYCGVLPDGWFIDDPSNYRLRGGGQMTVTYRGPNGARLQLREGAFCAEENGCVPSGQDAGAASFGGRDGTLVVLEGGGYAIVADRGAPLSWLAIGTNIDEAQFRDIAAALHLVQG